MLLIAKLSHICVRVGIQTPNSSFLHTLKSVDLATWLLNKKKCFFDRKNCIPYSTEEKKKEKGFGIVWIRDKKEWWLGESVKQKKERKRKTQTVYAMLILVVLI